MVANVKSVAVIGAGVSGLTAIKACLEEGLEPVCFEKSSNIGGIWVFPEEEKDDPNGRSSIYEGLITNVTKQMMAYSDFAYPRKLPPFLMSPDVLQYLSDYADKFDLNRHIRFNTEVLRVTKTTDFAETGRWNVCTRTENGETKTEVFDAVMVCTGCYSSGTIPNYPGLSSFKGRVMHSCQFRRGADFKDKTVLVVGSCHSAGDVAVLCSNHAKQVILSLRDGAWVLPRVFCKQPVGIYINQRWKDAIPNKFKSAFFKQKLKSVLDWKSIGLQSSKNPLNSSIMVNDDLPMKIMSGRVCVRSGIERFDESKVIFTDQSELENVDCVIFATGYNIKTPYLDDSIISDDHSQRDLYMLMVPPRLEHFTLAAIGFMMTRGSASITAELQSRFATRMFKGDIRLPSLTEMMEEITGRKDAIFQQYGHHKPLVIPTTYNDAIAKAIGILPSFWGLLFTDPKLAFHFYFGPAYPECYRLAGPLSDPDAREKFLRSADDLMHGVTMKTVRPEAAAKLSAQQRSHFVLFVFAVVCILGFFLAMLT